MAKLVSFLTLLTFALFMAGTAASSPTDFIKSSCKATRYPELCVGCLSGYASVIQRNMTKVRGIKPREYQAAKDCIENMVDSVDRLSQSVRELGHTGRAVGRDFLWHVSNVQTWVSAALTDENTCLDGFAGHLMDGNVKVAIKRRINNVAQVTSNALALVDRFASRHRARNP
ncbi:21 kDa protein-like [Populus alba x Populus x berolinensis]|nr:21 kDa protein-like [Populus alba x Populus x berolinensis]